VSRACSAVIGIEVRVEILEFYGTGTRSVSSWTKEN
jgi:hypothetical protein